MTPQEQKLAKRIHNQRRRLRWFEALNNVWDSHWRRSALAYRRQLIEAGIEPKRVWPITYRRRAPSETALPHTERSRP